MDGSRWADGLATGNGSCWTGGQAIWMAPVGLMG